MGNVRRIYVEKKAPFAVKAKELKGDLKNYLNLKEVEDVRMFIRYDVEHISDEVFEKACTTVFSEPPVDILYREQIEVPENGRVFSVEFLPGQFDQRADSALQCVKFLNEEEEPIIRTAVTYLITGKLTDDEFDRIKAYCINPVDSRETDMIKPETLETVFEEPADVKIFDGFKDLPEEDLKALRSFHDGNPRAGYLLVGSLPPYHLLHRAEKCGIRRGLLQDAHGKHLPELSGYQGGDF